MFKAIRTKLHYQINIGLIGCMMEANSEAPEASRCGGGRNRRKGTFMCQSLLLKQIGNRRLAYGAKHLLRTYCDLESRSNCSIIVTADEKQLASI